MNAINELERLRAALISVRQYLVDVAPLLGEPGDLHNACGVGGVVARIDAALNPAVVEIIK